MKTVSQHLTKFTMIFMVGFFTISVSAQKGTERESELIYLDTISVETNQNALEKLVFKLVLDEKFKYRKALRKSKAFKTQYQYSGTIISETEILKHFKKAARKSDSVQEFVCYFYDRNLPFLGPLDGDIIASLYVVIRKTTINGYFDELEALVGSNY